MINTTSTMLTEETVVAAEDHRIQIDIAAEKWMGNILAVIKLR